MNNFLEKVPMRVCEMDLKSIDVSFNPVIQPPLETCERGIFSMRRYYHCLRLEEQSKSKAMEEAQKKAGRQKKKKGYASFLQNISISKSASPHGSKHTESSARGKSLALPASPLTNAAQTKQSIPTFPTVPVHDVIVGTNKDITGFESFDDTVGTGVNDGTKMMDEVVDPGKTVNDTLKVIFVGMAMVGKTSMIKRLIEGRNAVIPTHVERTVGVDIYSWDPKKDSRFEHIDSRIELQDKELAETCGDVDVKFSCFDFAGKCWSNIVRFKSGCQGFNLNFAFFRSTCVPCNARTLLLLSRALCSCVGYGSYKSGNSKKETVGVRRDRGIQALL